MRVTNDLIFQIDHNFTLNSEGKYFRVTFRSNEIMEGVGFKASYKFIKLKAKNRTKLIEEVVESSSADEIRRILFLDIAFVMFLSFLVK